MKSSGAWPSLDTEPYMRWFDPEAWDCYDLVREFYRCEFNVELPAYGGGSSDVPAALTLAKLSGDWQEVQAPEFGVVAVFDFSRERHGHVGVMVEPLRVLHVVENGPTTLSRIDGPGWGPSLRGFYRWRREFLSIRTLM